MTNSINHDRSFSTSIYCLLRDCGDIKPGSIEKSEADSLCKAGFGKPVWLLVLEIKPRS